MEITGDVNRESETELGSRTKALCVPPTPVPADVTQGFAPAALVFVQPPGSAGVVTPSKFSLNSVAAFAAVRGARPDSTRNAAPAAT